MKKIFKTIVKKFLVFYYSKKNKVICDYKANVNYQVIKKCGEGCKFLGEVSISKNVNIGRFTSINGPGTRFAANINNIKIGSFCSIASGTTAQEYYHKYDRITTYYINKNIFGQDVKNDIFSKGDIVIEDDVWIGSNCVILSGVTIGRGSIIGAGSVVTKNIPKYTIVGGNPAKVISKRFKDETIEYLENLKWWEWDIEKIKNNKEIFSLKEDELLKFKFQ